MVVHHEPSRLTSRHHHVAGFAEDYDYWESYYSRSLLRRGRLRVEDCYCSAEELLPLLSGARGAAALVVGSGSSEVPRRLLELPSQVTLEGPGMVDGGKVESLVNM